MIAHTRACATPVVEHWLEREITQWEHILICVAINNNNNNNNNDNNDNNDDVDGAIMTTMTMTMMKLLPLIIIRIFSSTGIYYIHIS